MNKNITQFLEALKRNFVFDYTNLYLALFSLILIVLDTIIWQTRLSEIAGQQVFRIPVSPLIYVYIILVLNGALAFLSFDKDKSISYLLWSGTLFIALLVLILQIYYLSHI